MRRFERRLGAVATAPLPFVLYILSEDEQPDHRAGDQGR
jgi:hypothetical protein